jgi:hypothetical protein
MPVAGVSAAEFVEIAVPAAAFGASLAAIVKLWIDRRTERHRRQPIVICNEERERLYEADVGAWVALAHLRNESDVPAFNVRFGVEYGGVRFPYKMEPGDPDEGNYQRVVSAGARLPADESMAFPIAITSEDIWGTALVKGALDEDRVYWCRYQNARGETWETRNPGNRSAPLDIRPRYWIKRIEKRERQERQRVREGPEWDRLVAALGPTRKVS